MTTLNEGECVSVYLWFLSHFPRKIFEFVVFCTQSFVGNLPVAAAGIENRYIHCYSLNFNWINNDQYLMISRYLKLHAAVVQHRQAMPNWSLAKISIKILCRPLRINPICTLMIHVDQPRFPVSLAVAQHSLPIQNTHQTHEL